MSKHGMTADDQPSPADISRELARELRNLEGVSEVSESADDDSAIVTAYVGADHADAVESAAENRNFDVVHRHDVGGETYYLFGWARE